MVKRQLTLDVDFGGLEGPLKRLKKLKLWSLLKQKRRGRLLTIEGLDGSGKTTIIQLLTEELLKQAIPFKIIEMFPRTQLNDLVFWDDTFTPLQRTLLLKINADQARVKIAKALEENVLVICERGGDTFMAYQGFGEDLLPEVWTLGTIFNAFPDPDLTLYLDIPETLVEERLVSQRKSRSRMKARLPKVSVPNQLGRPTDPAFYKRVREGFLYIKENFPNRVVRIDASASLPDVYAAALQAVQPVVRPARSKTTINKS